MLYVYRKVFTDVLELEEHSLDLNLTGNCLRIRFQGLAILEGTSIHETKTNVVILVSTISAVHRFVLPHPARHVDASQLGSTNTIPSIFTEASQSWLRDSASHQVISSMATNISLPYTAASCLAGSGQGAVSVFAVANPTSISCIRMGQSPSSISTHTLQPSSNLTRLLSGYLPNVLRGGSGQENEETTASLALLPTNSDETFVLALSKGLKLRMWSATNQECRLDCDLTEYFGDKSGKQLGSQHRIRWCQSGSDYQLAIFSSFGKSRSFLLFNLQTAPAKIVLITSVIAQHSRLVDFSLSTDHIYALWSSSRGEFLLEFLELSNPKQQWQSITLEPGVDSDVEYDETVTDPKEAYLQAIFKPGVFSMSTLARALQAFDRSGAKKRNAGNIREDIIAAIEMELHEQISDNEDMSEEDFLQLSAKCWAQFYAYVVQYHMKRPVPVGLLIDEATGFHGLLKRGMISFLRPLDVVESLVLHRGRHWNESPYSEVSPIFSQPPVCSGLVALLEVNSASHYS